MRARKSAGSVAGSRSRSKAIFGCTFETTARAAIVSPLSVTTPAARPLATMISRTPLFVRISTPALGAGARHRLGHRPHAADRVTPQPLLAVDLAEAMMQEHVARAGRVGAGVGPDDAVEAEERLDRIALEPLVEHVAGRAGEDFDEVALPLEAEGLEAKDDARRLEALAQGRAEPPAGRKIGRRLERKRAQDVGHPFEPGLVGEKPLGVAERKLPHLVLGSTRRGLEVAAVGQGQELEIGRGTILRPWRLSSRSRTTLGLSSETA